MTIGETLKFFRLSQGKSKKDWVDNIITASYYGKIESNLHQIRMDVFLELLQRNHISTIEFFKR
ncbi:hypothetical protein PT285_04270 [Lactobacillus sp. ESL0791]|uniref:hypothetical protein n=1 Tax=Lactobacillus sp. ESL0791 TaxID=2983234 RepID=UPI0023F9578D|nr:hypothetical protein [Lactobacillus sp. ESL0791]MDF7638614.1 hypothetical protein [Lactobacillus sp. ESL0791]